MNLDAPQIIGKDANTVVNANMKIDMEGCVVRPIPKPRIVIELGLQL